MLSNFTATFPFFCRNSNRNLSSSYFLIPFPARNLTSGAHKLFEFCQKTCQMTAIIPTYKKKWKWHLILQSFRTVLCNFTATFSFFFAGTPTGT
jgi:hypothetical protein